MGDRANYIIKSGNDISIRYTHWRATCIMADMYRGEERFIKYVKECEIRDVITNMPWIQGCVVIDIVKRELSFWSWEQMLGSSVSDYYLAALAKKWPDWNVTMLRFNMYEVEQILGIDYISRQERSSLDFSTTKDAILREDFEDWEGKLIVMRRNGQLHITKCALTFGEGIIIYGSDILDLLLQKPQCQLPRETDDETCVVIDADKKQLIMRTDELDIWKENAAKWDGYSFIAGDFAYVEILRQAEIDISEFIMTEPEVIEGFTTLVENDNTFNPIDFAKSLGDVGDAQFNPSFFNTTRPAKSLTEKIIGTWKRILGSK